MKFGSVCSGIEAASVAFGPIGWEAAWFSEIEPFPCAVLAHHYPEVPNLGDMTTIAERIRSGEVEAPDVFVGGTPCQAFSVAGLRNSLDDARGNLSLVFCKIAAEIDAARSVLGLDPAIVLWENVPGVLSTKDNAFGCFLGELAGEDGPLVAPGGKWTNAGCVFGSQRAVAWRILDAQYFGVAQRRRRLFVVASARDGFSPAEVLFESNGVRRDTAPSRQTGQGTSRGVEFGPSGGRFTEVNPTLDTRAKDGPIRNQLAGCVAVTGTLEASMGRSRGAGINPATLCVATGQAGAEIGAEIAPTLNCNHEAPYAVYAAQMDIAPTLDQRAGRSGANTFATSGGLIPVAYGIRTANTSSNGWGIQEKVTHTLDCAQGIAVAQPAYSTKLHNTTSNQAGKIYEEYTVGLDRNSPPPALLTAMQVRRLTPVECARLQGFPDDYLDITVRNKPAADGPKYKALGNSWAVPNVAWIGRRIAAVAGVRVAA